MAQIPSTKAAFRNQLPQPAPESEKMGWGGELEAVEAIFTAYMALNAAGGGREPLAVQDGDESPMSLVARGGKAALARIAGVGTRGGRIIWDEMVDNGSGARWNYNLWRTGQI